MATGIDFKKKKLIASDFLQFIFKKKEFFTFLLVTFNVQNKIVKRCQEISSYVKSVFLHFTINDLILRYCPPKSKVFEQNF